jgi:hypothetical protein
MISAVIQVMHSTINKTLEQYVPASEWLLITISKSYQVTTNFAW